MVYMKNRFLKPVLLLLYCIPFAFLSVNGDAAFGTVFYYVLTAISFAGLCFTALKTGSTPVIYIGNALSLASSYAAAKLSGMEPMGAYFKPFTSYGVIVVISLLAMLLQTAFVLAVQRKRRKNS